MDLPLIHARQARPFIDFLNQAGLPTERLLRQMRLPTALIDPVDGYIAERLLWQLIDVAAHSEGMDDLGLHIGRTIDLNQLGGLAERMSQAPTLHCALETFRYLARGESSHANF